MVVMENGAKMGPKILVVDDESTVSDLIQMQFRQQIKAKELSFEFALNGVEALEKLADAPDTDIVLTDINMPQMDGITLLEKIQQLHPTIKTVVISAYGDMEKIRGSMNRGAHDFLIKPVDIEDLKITIEKTYLAVREHKEYLRLLAEKEHLLQKTLEHQKELTDIYGKFVPHEFLKLLDKESILDIKLGDHIQKNMTIFFSDISTFGVLSGKLSAQENFNFLNSYLRQMAPIVRKNNGFVDKYIGDSIMALFDKEPEDALQTALEMQDLLLQYNEGRQRAGYVPIKIGIGINTGDLMLGTLGSAERMESTVISDAVNVTARIEQLNRVYDTQLLIGNETFLKLKNPLEHSIRIMDYVQVKGKSLPMLIYEVFDKDPPEIRDKKLATKDIFEQGWLLYQSQNYFDALPLFQKCLAKNPTDKIIQIYIERCENFLEFGLPPASLPM